MTKEEKIELLLQCRSKAITPKELLSKLNVPESGYSLFLCNEVLYWEDKESDVLSELELLNDEVIFEITNSLEHDNVSGKGFAYITLCNIGLKSLNAYLPELAKKVESNDPSVFGKTKGLGILIEEDEILRPRNLEEFKSALSLHPSDGIEEWFDGLASCLMNNLIITTGKSKYRVVECEFYYYNETSHPDPFVHGFLSKQKNHPQQSFGNLFWNDAGGIDLTFGKPGVYAGILVRSLKLLGETSGKYINGLWAVTSTLINGMGSVLEGNASIKLVTIWEGEGDEIAKSTRVNLKTTENLPSVSAKVAEEFRLKRYRYLVEIDEVENKFVEKTLVRKLNQ